MWVCTVRHDGRPHLTPAWFVYEGDTFWICLNGSSVKNRNASHHPTVSLALEDGNTPVVAEGSVEVHERPYPDGIVGASSTSSAGTSPVTTPMTVPTTCCGSCPSSGG